VAGKVSWFAVHSGPWAAVAASLSLEDEGLFLRLATLIQLHGVRGAATMPPRRWALLARCQLDRFLEAVDRLHELGALRVEAGVRPEDPTTIACPMVADTDGFVEEKRRKDRERRNGDRQEPGHADVEPIPTESIGIHQNPSESKERHGIGHSSEVKSSEEHAAPLRSASAELPPVAPLAPSSAADAAASPPPAERSGEWPEVPEELCPFERWHSPEASDVPRLRSGQRAFLERWPETRAQLLSAFPSLDLGDQLRQAYAWETLNPKTRKTPAGRADFLFRWCARSQDKAAASSAARAPPPNLRNDASALAAARTASLRERVPKGDTPIAAGARARSNLGPFGPPVGQHGGYLRIEGDRLELFSFEGEVGHARCTWIGSASAVKATHDREQERLRKAKDDWVKQRSRETLAPASPPTSTAPA